MQGFAAKELQIPLEAMDRRIQELVMLLPDLPTKLAVMKPEVGSSTLFCAQLEARIMAGPCNTLPRDHAPGRSNCTSRSSSYRDTCHLLEL